MGIKISTRAPHKGTLLNESPLALFLSGNDCCAGTQRAKKSDVHRLGAKAKRPVNSYTPDWRKITHPCSPHLRAMHAPQARLVYWTLCAPCQAPISKYLFINSILLPFCFYYQGHPKLIDELPGYSRIPIKFTVSGVCRNHFFSNVIILHH
jgi:hypothetical protein